IYGELPRKEQFDDFTKQITYHTLVHEDIKKILDGFPSNSHPMGVLSSLICSLSAFYPDSLNPNSTPEEMNLSMIRLLAKMPTFAAWAYKNKMGHPVNYPDNSLDYCSNFLKMMFAFPAEQYKVDPIIKADGGNAKKYLDKAKDKNDSFRLMGFGHRVYKNFDPRAKIIKKAADDVLGKLGVKDPVLDIAKELEFAALNDPYFVERKLYPNVDFYSGIIYRALGIPTDMFTVMFALGRLPGWIAQWKEMTEKGEPIGRPRQVYTGATERGYVAMSNR
ncbi:MAG: citrate (Si)-synthase, partial [Cyclobacteriaceae bacterium]|nr:citrate (Si)-synthase [Cyclobacteriaceae bacterium]